MPALATPVSPPPSTQTFHLTLTKALEGNLPPFLPLDIQFAYDWNFAQNTGHATVLSIGSNNTVNQDMFPMGISKRLAFMARDKFDVAIDGPDGNKEEIFAYRVILNMDKETTETKTAAVMLGEEGDVIIATENWGATEVL
ncbi:hypothetical protein TWF106_006783 [Orbilia oligospora]|uniref:Uncharacterized protein n=1 Tax=Orbilia oligospora TaxID=2813651 RepID=A0A6G1MG96_ORBOL|nr:hypothetical protein TWF788_001889 [Orbilia oligospora]KAF3197714.1 hypothetical protein TWF679_002810 [Orbilia oligospora]KAF3220458.1 hypothetical protein TWF106_006783 [Orbilia oligospora]KAF3230231.1 hypothetical protein TWF191_010929 [Orbilia oligospora]KAF3256467.1 hypothetical protein TWF192_001891 [Orbilia oligospora]